MSWDDFVNGLALSTNIVWDWSKPGLETFFFKLLPEIFEKSLYFFINIAPAVINLLSQVLSSVLSAL